jgi:hypothetical protein
VLTRRRPFGLGLDMRTAGQGRRSSRRLPFRAWDALSSPERHPVVAAVSFVFHGALVLLLLYSPRLARKPAEQPRPAPQDTRSVQMVYLPPPARERPKPPPQVKPATPAFPDAVPRPTTEPPSPATAKVPNLPRHDEAAAMSPKPSERPGAADRSAASGEPRPTRMAEAEREDAMVSEARRLFGPAPSGDANVAGPLATGLPLPFNNAGPRCAWGGGDATPIDRPAVGVIEGIVRTESGGRPIPGAFLQMLGTGSATFSDATGHYRLTFDPSLVDACRSQVVRVTARGYRARTMILTWGLASDNAVDMSGSRPF